MATTTLRTAQRAFSIKAWTNAKRNKLTKWLHAESKIFTKLFHPLPCKTQKENLSLPRQNYFSGTDAADPCRLFLYPYISENNTTAPCRVCGNAPGSFAEVTSTARSAVLLCQKTSVMSTTTLRTAQRAFSIKAWTNAKCNKLTKWLHAESKIFTAICQESCTRLEAIHTNLLGFCLLLTALAVETNPLVSVIALICAAILTRQLNKNQQNKKKGGRK